MRIIHSNKNECGVSFQELINNKIQKNRNNGAHYKSDISIISGSDIENEIRKYFIFLDKLFFIYELNFTINLCLKECNGIVIEIEAFPVDEAKKQISSISSERVTVEVYEENT